MSIHTHLVSATAALMVIALVAVLHAAIERSAPPDVGLEGALGPVALGSLY